MLMRASITVFGAGLLFSAMLFAADLTGIWMGEVAGKNAEKQDLAFQFQSAHGAVTGVMFGDEFDLPVEDLKIEGDHVTFSVVSTNYYNKQRTRTVYKGTVSEKTLELTREQIAPEPAKSEKPKEPAPRLILKRLS